MNFISGQEGACVNPSGQLDDAARVVSSVGRALRLHRRCREFEPLTTHHLSTSFQVDMILAAGGPTERAFAAQATLGREFEPLTTHHLSTSFQVDMILAAGGPTERAFAAQATLGREFEPLTTHQPPICKANLWSARQRFPLETRSRTSRYKKIQTDTIHRFIVRPRTCPLRIHPLVRGCPALYHDHRRNAHELESSP